jgi:L-iditol 2-dehydrogenase
MKKIILASPGKFEVLEDKKPQLKSGNDVLVKVAAVGVCGSDIHYFRQGAIGEQKISYPFIIGHECSGIVEQVGNKVTKIKKDDRVAIDPAISCGICDQCLAGRRHTCRKLSFMGNPLELNGCLQEYIIVPEESCYKLKDNIDLDNGAFIEPLTIGLQAVNFNKDGKDIAILGSGPIGISVLISQKAKLKECTFFVTDKIDSRLDFAKQKGAHWTANPVKNDIVKDILKEKPEGLDVVYECCGEQEALDQAVELLKPGGRLIIVGIPEKDIISFPVHTLRRKEITINNVRRQNEKVEDAISLVSSGDIDLKGIVTHNYNFSDTQKAFELVNSYADNVIKANINF